MAGEDIISPALIGIVISTVIFIVALITLLVLRRTVKRRRTVLLVGLSESGKTLMYSRLITNKPLNTYTSMTENICDNVIIDAERNTAPLTLVDIPGEDRIRMSTITKYLEDSTIQIIGIICVIDSATFSKQTSDVAELVFDILKSKSNNCPVLFACNKQDSVQAKSSNLIKTALAKELNLINKSRYASLEMTGSSKSKISYLQIVGDQFDWSTDAKKATFVEIQCKQQSSDIGSDHEADDDCVARVRDWIAYIK